MPNGLDRIAAKATSDPECRFTSLAHWLTPAFLKETWYQLNRRGAAGVDGEVVEMFEAELNVRLEDLHARLRSGSYRPPSVRRVEIPKEQGKTRALGIPTVEDRLVQAAVARLLNRIYEADFQDCSFGYRPQRGCHDALRVLRSHLIGDKVMHIHEADIRAYFDRVHHDWLKRMLERRIADPVILRLIRLWLKAGVMVDGVVQTTEEGVPQGGPISPILANVYLHHVLDLWFERVVRPRCRGQAHLVRYADDFVACFQRGDDAARYDRALKARMGRFSLELSPDKTRRITFGRFARERLAQSGDKPCEFEFLGFRHICGTDRRGRFAVIRLPAQKSLRRFRDRVRDWLWRHMHWKVRDQRWQLARMLHGFYQYYALPHCVPKLSGLHHDVMRYWRRILLRRSQRHRVHWSRLRQQSWFQLPTPRTLHPNI